MQLVGAGLGSRVQDTTGVTDFGRIFRLLHLELLKRVDRRLNHRAALVVIGHIHAVKQERGLASAHAANRLARPVIRPDAEQVAAAGQQRRARSEPREFIKAAAVQRQIHNLVIADDMAESSRFRIEQRRCRRYLDAGVGLADAQFDIRAR